MSDDIGRKFLVTKLACAQCGSVLYLTYNKPPKNERQYCEGEPSGGFIYENMIYVHPCEKCLQPAKDAKRAVEIILGIIKE